MAYTRRTAVTLPRAKLRPVSEEGGIDERLDRLALEIAKRMEAELDRYSVPQLLSGLHKCLQVRVLLLTLKMKGGGSDVGSSVKRYAANFQTQNASSRGKRSPRPRSYDDDPNDTVVDLIASADDDIELG